MLSLYLLAQSCHRHFTQQSSSSMGAKRAGGMEQVKINSELPKFKSFAQKEGITIFVPSKSSVAFNLQAECLVISMYTKGKRIICFS